MKKVSILSLIAFIIFITGCIPSIHPIYTDENRMVNDSILGSWALYEDDNINLSFSIKSDSKEDQEEGEKMMQELLNEEKKPTSTWTFERAANITGEIKISGGSGSINLYPGAPSLLNEKTTITHQEELPFYILTHRQKQLFDTIETVMIVNMTQIGENTFMDFYPYTLKDERVRGRFASNFINGHTFAKVVVQEGQIEVLPLNYDYMTKLIKEKRIRLKHERLGEDDIILTASTSELRSFLRKYGNDQRLFEDAEYLTVN
ncbi:MAG: hypothetical protein HKN68_08770 [Saprospiraceae bacterium]|nr:hypothetical protein [Saprospiraceae bacterium]